MKLLFCIESLESGGAQRQLVTLATGLARRGHEVEVFTYAPKLVHFQHELKSLGIRLWTYQKTHRFSPRPILKIRQLIASGQCDAVLAFLATPSFYVEFASVFLPIPVVVSERSSYESLRFGKKLLLNGHRLADHITVNSHHHRERLVRDFPWMSGRISTIFNGVDTDRFDATISSDSYFKTPRLLAIGRLVRSKNALAIVEALVLLRDHRGACPHVDWVGKIQDVAYRDQCDEALRQSGLTDYWHWLGECHETNQLYPKYWGLIHSSVLEGFPNVVCEAMACETPVLVGRIGDHERIVTDGKSGLLFDASSPESICDAMHRLLSLSLEERREMGRQGRQVAEREFSLTRYVDEYESLLLRVAQHGSE